MPADAVSFEMTDAMVKQAVREECVGFAREHWKLRDVLVIAASAAIFVSAVRGNAHWLWWIAALHSRLDPRAWRAAMSDVCVHSHHSRENERPQAQLAERC